MPRAFSDSERERLRARLIAAGKRLINQSGTRALTVAEAARAAGLSKGSFYAFFSSKEDFVLTVFESWEKEYRDSALAAVLHGEGTPRERLEHFFIESFDIFEREPGLTRLGFGEIMRIMEHLPPERLTAHQQNDSRTMEAAIGSWIEKGLAAAEDIPALGGLMSSLFALVIHREDFPKGSYRPAVRLIAEALAMRITQRGGGHGQG
jgi:AcrR family transcriptional regulator